MAQMIKNSPAMQETQEMRFLYLGPEDPMEKGMAAHSWVAWRIPRTEEPGGLQSMGSQRVGHDLAAKQQKETLLPGPHFLNIERISISWGKLIVVGLHRYDQQFSYKFSYKLVSFVVRQILGSLFGLFPLLEHYLLAKCIFSSNF